MFWTQKNRFIQKDLKKWDKIIAALLAIILLCYSFYGRNRDYTELKAHGKLTVGVTTGFHYGGHGDEYIKYRYCVQEKMYEDQKYYSGLSMNDRKGEKFIVLYSSMSPELSLIFFDERTEKGLCDNIEDKQLRELNFVWWRYLWSS